ncbi:stAR-related lipid transfer protein 5-like isoform X1 [Crassostrea angulata]|uniref:START domain-containing protein n=1 Tax=Magallana gigas TaxID=29159 RepID=A0A8W8IBU6_MAGGI|nr:stAR-related lipid transfer protein 5 isoform X1 [Crassostrea gigas]XP_052697913.1 stAR-related lipid transfer protein 5-like isoform X1 [Crassostrea angulata]|eukprot:XP_011445353.1 PREDICTED: stAR-related lipid transfer protein 5 isoform X1 [Crassostrea gigas]
MDFRKIAEGVADRLQKYYKTAEGWTSAKKSKNFEISYRQSEEFSGHLYKGEAIYNCPPKTVFDYVEPLPDGPRAKWDTNMKKIEILKWIETPDLRINRACTASAMLGLISPRDFVDLILVRETDECFSTNAISIEYPECPEVKDHVRGWNWSCGMICVKYPDDPNKCKLVSLIQPDIKGMLPKNVVESAIPGSMVEFFTKLEEALKKDGKISS